MLQLRNGRDRRDDPRLDRIPLFDEASRAFPIRGLISSEILVARRFRSYTWRVPVVLDQGREGACVGYGIAAELAGAPVKVPEIDDAFARDLYYEAQRRDPWPGGEYPGARPRYSGTSVLSGIKVAHERGYFGEYRWAFGINDVLLGIGYHGPCVLGINWHDSMYEPRDGRVIVEGPVVGGHCILANAVSIRDRTVTLHNSWGPTWGVNGEAVISWSDLEALLLDEGEAAFFVKRRNPNLAKAA